MARLDLWLSMGMTLLGIPAPGAAEGASAPGEAANDHAHPFLGGFLRESRIVYPLTVGEWQAVGEHLYEDQEYGVSVRYAHGSDVDRWIDVYFYPAGLLSAAEFAEAARNEADLIGQAHRQAGHTGFDIGALHEFSLAGDATDPSTTIPARAVELGYTIHGTAYSSAMTLLLDRLYFIKARYSIAQARLSRADTLRQLEQFTTRLHPRLVVLSTGDCWMPMQVDLATGRATTADGAQMLRRGLPPGCAGDAPLNPVVPDGMREIRLEYHAPAQEHDDPPARSIGIGRSRVG